MIQQPEKTEMREELLAELHEALGNENWKQARSLVDLLLDIDQRFLTYSHIAKLRNDFPTWQKGLVKCNIAVLGNGTLNICENYLLGEGVRRGLDVRVFIGPYNQYFSTIFSPESPLNYFKPDIIVFYWDFESIVSLLLDRPSWSDSQQFESLLKDTSQDWHSLQVEISKRFKCITLWPTLSSSSFGPGILDGVVENSPRCWEQRFNNELTVITETFPEAFMWDLGGLMNRVGLERWEDKRLRVMGDVPCAHEWWPRVTRQIIRYAAVLKGKACKLVIVDGDNTLWGGVVGEDGVGGVSIRSGNYGDAYRRIQSWLLGLKSRGVLITVASKNNPEDVALVFEENDEMLLTTEDIAAWEVSWDAKPENIRKMLKRLNLNGEQAVFIDDSHVERALMRAELPEITVPELPQDINQWPTFLGNSPWFDNFSLTPEDGLRTKRYLDERKRTKALAGVDNLSFEDKKSFYLKLKVEVDAFEANQNTVPRLAQMTQRTNQFNFTTWRLTEGEIEEMINDPVFEVIGANVKDRYGDYGICGLVILQFSEKAVLRNLLLSCRALGRGVEDALKKLVIMRTQARGYQECEIHFLPSGKNKVAETFLKDGAGCLQQNESQSEIQIFTWPDNIESLEILDTAKLMVSVIGE